MEVLENNLSLKNGGNTRVKELISIWLERKTTLLPKLMSEELVFQVRINFKYSEEAKKPKKKSPNLLKPIYIKINPYSF